MSEEQVWVHHPGLDRWSEVAETSLDTWADLGWEYKPDGPPSAKLDEAVLTPEVDIVTAPPADPPKVEKVEPEVSIQTPEPPASTTAAS